MSSNDGFDLREFSESEIDGKSQMSTEGESNAGLADHNAATRLRTKSLISEIRGLIARSAVQEVVLADTAKALCQSFAKAEEDVRKTVLRTYADPGEEEITTILQEKLYARIEEQGFARRIADGFASDLRNARVSEE
jgi:hypothetical protein